MNKILVFWIVFLIAGLVCLVMELINGASVWAYISSGCILLLGAVNIVRILIKNKSK